MAAVLIRDGFHIAFGLLVSALGASLLYEVLPLILINDSEQSMYDFRFNISRLRGAFVDLVLLLLVLRIGKSYLQPARATKLSERALKTMSIAGLIVATIPLSFSLLWLYVESLHQDHYSRMLAFYRLLPRFLHGELASTFLSPLCALLSVTLSGIALQLKHVLWKGLNIFVLVLSCLLLLLNLFWLM